MKPSLGQTISRSCRLRCPACGEGKIAKSWRETHERCPCCGLDFRVEGGFYLGSIYMNYGIMAALLLGTGMPLVWFGYVSPAVASTVGVLMSVPLSIWLWRYARSLWLGLGYLIDHNVRAATPNHDSVEEREEKLETHVHSDEESMNCVCPFCHERFQFAESRARSWAPCAFCGQQVFLLPVREPANAEEST